MPHEAINAVLDLEGLYVIGTSVTDESLELVIESRHGAGACPRCGGAATEPKERPQVCVRDLAICGRPTMLRWIKRRWQAVEISVS